MKILRIRRGFTTNSSGANEFLPSDSGSVPSARASAGPMASSRPMASGRPMAADAGPRGVLTSVEPWGNQAPPNQSSSNSITIGVIFLVVVGAFVAAPVARMLWRKKTRAPPGPASGDDAP